MTDEELLAWLKIQPGHAAIDFIANLQPKKRELYERMARLEREVQEAVAGRAPWPKDVLIDRNRRR